MPKGCQGVSTEQTPLASSTPFNPLQSLQPVPTRSTSHNPPLPRPPQRAPPRPGRASAYERPRLKLPALSFWLEVWLDDASRSLPPSPVYLQHTHSATWRSLPPTASRPRPRPCPPEPKKTLARALLAPPPNAAAGGARLLAARPALLYLDVKNPRKHRSTRRALHANLAAAAPIIPISRSSFCRVPPRMRSIHSHSIHPHKWHLCGCIERIPGEPGKMTVRKPGLGEAAAARLAWVALPGPQLSTLKRKARKKTAAASCAHQNHSLEPSAFSAPQSSSSSS